MDLIATAREKADNETALDVVQTLLENLDRLIEKTNKREEMSRPWFDPPDPLGKPLNQGLEALSRSAPS